MDGWMNGCIGDGRRAWMVRWIVIDEKKQWMQQVMDEQRETRKRSAEAAAASIVASAGIPKRNHENSFEQIG